MKRSTNLPKDYLLFGKGMEEVWQNLFEADRPLLDRFELLIPSIDIYETGQAVCMEVELPGVEPEAIQLYTVQNILFIEVEKRDEGVEDKARKCVNYLCIERKFGRVQRKIELPAPCHPQKARARFKNGVLTIEFEKITERRGQRHNILIEPGP
jgi:HSP20 family protein